MKITECLTAEHQKIRQALSAIAGGKEVRMQASQLVEILREHIQKEDRILFPLVQQFLGTETLVHLAEECSRRVNP